MPKKSAPINGTQTPSLIIDILSTECRWIPQEALIDMIVERRPVTRSSAHKAIERLRKAGRIKSRRSLRPVLDMVNGELPPEYFCDEWAVDVA